MKGSNRYESSEHSSSKSLLEAEATSSYYSEAVFHPKIVKDISQGILGNSFVFKCPHSIFNESTPTALSLQLSLYEMLRTSIYLPIKFCMLEAMNVV